MARDISKKQKESTLAKELKREISQGKKDPKSRKAVAKKVLTGLSLYPIGKAIQVGGKTLKGFNTAIDKKIATETRKNLKTIERKASLKVRKSMKNRDKLQYAIKEPSEYVRKNLNASIDLKATKNLKPKKKVNIDLTATKKFSRGGGVATQGTKFKGTF